MPDELDRVQAMTELHLQNAIDNHVHRPRPQGLSHCEDQDCGEPISDQRRAMGARRCVDCQSMVEAREVHIATWRRGR